MTPSSPHLAERYGVPSRTRHMLVLGAVGALVVAAAAWLLWVTVLRSGPEVTSQLVGYDVAGEHQATATYTVVRRDTDVSATCLLRAFAADHAVVGELSVPVRSGPTSVRMRSTIRTEREATSVDLVGCTTSTQSTRH